jgi:hypothetical protein
MAKAGKTHMGVAEQAQGAGTGALTEIDKDLVGENDVLSNRDKSEHSQDRGLDGKHVETAQYQDHAANRQG